MTETLLRSGESRTRPTRPRTGRRPVRRFLIVSHRWLSLVLGLVLLAITTSGAVLLYRPEIERATSHGAYDVSGKAPTIDLVDARTIVLEAHPSFDATSVWAENGVYRVTDYDTAWTVDPGTGAILGHVGKSPAWIGFLDNLHECFLSCEDYPAYVSGLAEEVPHTGWLGYEGGKVTYGGLVLGVLGLLLLYLSLTGIWLWFPRPSRWRGSMSVRWKRGRFARDTDLHKVAGMITLPFMLMWAITGAGFELGLVEKAWYAATPGGHQEYPDAVSTKSKAADVPVEQAVAAAKALHPGLRLVNVDVPAKDDPTAAYTMYFQDGFDPYGRTTYPGDVGVYVDRHTGVAKDSYGTPGESTAQSLWDSWNYPVHAGYVVNGWWRLVWLLFGLSPILLGITGISTWLVRRKARKNRKASRRTGTATPLPQGLAAELAADPEMDPGLAESVE